MTTEKWHVSKSINLGHILVTLSLFIGGFMYVADIDKEVSKHTVQIEAMSDRVSSIDNSHNALFDKIDAKLEKIFDLLYQMKND